MWLPRQKLDPNIKIPEWLNGNLKLTISGSSHGATTPAAWEMMEIGVAVSMGWIIVLPLAIKKYVLCTYTLVVLKKFGIPNVRFLYQQYQKYYFQLVIFTSEDIHVFLGSLAIDNRVNMAISLLLANLLFLERHPKTTRMVQLVKNTYNILKGKQQQRDGGTRPLP